MAGVGGWVQMATPQSCILPSGMEGGVRGQLPGSSNHGSLGATHQAKTRKSQVGHAS